MKDFTRFFGLVLIMYAGFDTTFAFLARGTFWFHDQLDFGSSYAGYVCILPICAAEVSGPY